MRSVLVSDPFIDTQGEANGVSAPANLFPLVNAILCRFHIGYFEKTLINSTFRHLPLSSLLKAPLPLTISANFAPLHRERQSLELP